MISHQISKRIVTVSGVALLCGGIAFAQSNSNMNSGQSGSMSATSSGQASRGDKMFARKALEGGMAEVQLGQLAAQKGGSDDVKQFGQKMVDDHTKLADQLKPIAQQVGVNPPASLSAKDQALLTKLQGESGDQFDKTYIKAMVKDHRKDLREFNKEAKSGKDSSLKDAASQGAQVIQQHLQLAEQMAQSHHISVRGGNGNPSAMNSSGTGGAGTQ